MLPFSPFYRKDLETCEALLTLSTVYRLLWTRAYRQQVALDKG